MNEATPYLVDTDIAWHRLDPESAVERLKVDPVVGLSPAEIEQRLTAHGPNLIREGKRRGPWRMLLDQFVDFMILILIAAAVISGVIGDMKDTIVILAIVVVNAIIGFIQEYRAERAIAALKQLAAPHAHVVRAGHLVMIPASELVPGDIVALEAGHTVPADLRLIESVNLRTDEAALTGESQPVEKTARALHEPDLPLADRRNMTYKGTLATYGRARGVVVATGMRTELGKIAALLGQEEEVKTPLQKRLARFGTVLAMAVIAICAIMFVAGMLRGEPLVLMLLTAISLAVAAIPEALPAVVTVSLALGARKMAEKNALIRRLPAVETLGSVTYICSDKTGTLTQNRMRVEETWVDGRLLRTGELGARAEGETPGAAVRRPRSALLMALALSNDARRDRDGRILGDPTEAALYAAAQAAGYDKAALVKEVPRLAEIPFDSDRQCMTTLHRVRGFPHPLPSPADAGEGESEYIVAFTKGAPEKLLGLCRVALTERGREPIAHAPIAEAVERMAADGLRVLAFACREWRELPADLSPETVESELVFLGLAGLMDPPREEARDAVATCMTAGITPVMITGDHPATARTIAIRLGIIGDGGTVITGAELARLPLAQFEEEVERVRVYARAAPEQKIKIVQALQDKGEFVAMTGDGVNDAPALKRANIGVAMGVTGTDVAKEAGHMVLLDDNFATIVSAVREGRHIFDNIRKFVRFVMTGNSGEIWTLFLAPFVGLPIPLLPIHILWVNLVTDGLPGLALAAEPEERGIMRRAPRPPAESLFAHGIWQHILWVGLLIGGLCIFTQAWAIDNGSAHWQTMVFTVLTLAQMAHVLAIRSERESLFTQGLFSNLPVLGAVTLTFALQLALIYVPWLQAVFHTQALSLEELVFCLVMASTVFIAVEIEKAFIRRHWIYTRA